MSLVEAVQALVDVAQARRQKVVLAVYDDDDVQVGSLSLSAHRDNPEIAFRAAQEAVEGWGCTCHSKPGGEAPDQPDPDCPVHSP